MSRSVERGAEFRTRVRSAAPQPPDSVTALRTVMAATSSATGLDFFRALVQAVAQVYGVRHVFVTECVGQPPHSIRMLAFYSDGAFAEPQTYGLDGTPCAAVVSGAAANIIEHDVQDRYLEDDDLVALEAESYIGLPLVGTNDHVVGHLALIDDRPHQKVDLPLFELLTARAAAELERDHALVRLAHSEDRMRRVIDLVPHFIFAKDASGRFLLVNEAVAEAYGKTTEELLGLSDGDVASVPAEAHEFESVDREVLERREPRFIPEESLTDSRGRRRILQTVKIPFAWSGDEPDSVLGVATDVTEIRRAEERLRSVVEGTASTTGDAFFRSLVQHFARALDVQFVFVGEFEGETVQTRAVWAVDRFGDPFSYPLPDSPCAGVARGEQCFHERGVREQYPDSPILARLEIESYFATPLFDFEDQPIGLLAVLDRRPLSVDIQDQYLLSIFASRAAAELVRQRIEDRSRQLQAQVLHVQKLESLGVLAGGIAHDFNNLLAGVMGNAGLLRMQLGGASQLLSVVGEIERAAERAAELANQMLAYSGKGRFIVDAHDLNELVRDMEELLGSSVSKKAELRLELQDDLPTVEADATQLRQVAMNLITNASDALTAEGGTIHVRTRTQILDEPAAVAAYVGDTPEPGCYVVLEVEDDGVGMSPETRDRLFEPFFSTKRTGRGLGMAAVLGIIRGHRGAITVDSQVDTGSVFRIYLPVSRPLAEATSEAISEATSGASPSASRAPGPADGPADCDDGTGGRDGRTTTHGTVLVVDDEEIVRNLARRVLERARFEVREANDGQEALDRVTAEPDAYDAILLDMTMPRLGGREVLRALRADGIGVPVVLTSGYSDLDELPELVDHDASFLKKPYRPTELQQALRSVITGTRAVASG